MDDEGRGSAQPSPCHPLADTHIPHMHRSTTCPIWDCSPAPADDLLRRVRRLVVLPHWTEPPPGRSPGGDRRRLRRGRPTGSWRHPRWRDEGERHVETDSTTCSTTRLGAPPRLDPAAGADDDDDDYSSTRSEPATPIEAFPRRRRPAAERACLLRRDPQSSGDVGGRRRVRGRRGASAGQVVGRRGPQPGHRRRCGRRPGGDRACCARAGWPGHHGPGVAVGGPPTSTGTLEGRSVPAGRAARHGGDGRSDDRVHLRPERLT